MAVILCLSITQAEITAKKRACRLGEVAPHSAVSRKPEGSNNRKRAINKLAKLHEKTANTRQDFHFELAHKLCDKAGIYTRYFLDFQFILF